MTLRTFQYSDFGMWACIFGIGFATVPMAQAAEPPGVSPGRPPFCDPASPPSRPCRPLRIDKPVPPAPGASNQTEPFEPYGILPHHLTIEEKIEKVRRDGKRSGLPPEVIEKIAQDMEKGLREEAARPKPEPEQTGIFPGEAIREQLGAGSSAYYFIENGWFDIVNGKEVSIYAGSMRSDPETQVNQDPLTTHGFVIVVKGQPGKSDTTSNRVYTPTAVGSLHITSAKGNILTLESRQGNRFLLNVESEKLTPIEKR